MTSGVLWFGLATLAVLVLAGALVLGVLAEQRHRRNEAALSAEVLVAAFRIHDVASRVREAMADEALREVRS